MDAKVQKILTYSAVAFIVIGGVIIYKRKATKSTSIVNKDGSKKEPVVSKKGTAATLVDKDKDYIEDADKTTLYNTNGDVIGDLDTNSGFFLNKSGNIIAAGDGTPIIVNYSNGTYTEPDGTVYNMNGSLYVTAENKPKEDHWYNHIWFGQGG